MTPDNIRSAILDAKEFIKRAKQVLDENNASNFHGIYASKSSGALRRQSLELTRALAEMRKP